MKLPQPIGFQKSRIRETPNLSTVANRSIDTEKNIKGLSSSSGDLVNRGWAALHSTAKQRLLIEYLKVDYIHISNLVNLYAKM